MSPAFDTGARRALAGAALAVLLATPSARADLEDAYAAGEASVLAAQASQARVEGVAAETDSLEAEYLRVMKELDGLQVYNAYMERQIASQEQELTDLDASIARISSIERQIMPLMIRMLDALERFVALDVPFLVEEREARVASLRALMERADVTAAEKFRRLTEAFLIEIDFGRTIETYEETLSLDGVKREATILRIGRVGLYYQTDDASRTGVWDREGGTWIRLDGGTARDQVRQGIRIARRQVAPELLLLDVPAPEVAR